MHVAVGSTRDRLEQTRSTARRAFPRKQHRLADRGKMRHAHRRLRACRAGTSRTSTPRVRAPDREPRRRHAAAKNRPRHRLGSSRALAAAANAPRSARVATAGGRCGTAAVHERKVQAQRRDAALLERLASACMLARRHPRPGACASTRRPRHRPGTAKARSSKAPRHRRLVII